MKDPNLVLFYVGALVVLGALYFVPIWIAMSRGVETKTGIVLLNIFFGLTLIGWIAALVLACTQRTHRDRIEAERRHRELVMAVAGSNSAAAAPLLPPVEPRVFGTKDVERGDAAIKSSFVLRWLFIVVVGVIIGLAAFTTYMPSRSNQPGTTTPSPAVPKALQRT